jgi:MSHA biogenesis protein MshP
MTMPNDLQQKSRGRVQGGFSLISALFLLVVLAALGAYMVNISGTQHFTTLHALQGARAYHAARSGTEWGIATALGIAACPAVTPSTLSPAGGLNAGNLSGFNVAVTLDSCTNHQEAGSSYNIYQITAFAQTVAPAYGAPGYAARRITVTVTNAP